MRRMPFYVRIAFTASLAALATFAPTAQTRTAAPPDLATMFGAAGLVRDSNGDGINDTVAARIVVPATPSREDSLAAANIAGRLGFETTSLTLPLVVRDTEVTRDAGLELPILIGRTNALVRSLIDGHVVDVASLQPGQGLIAAVPSPITAGHALVIVGGDEKGTLAAATEVAARLPRLWNMTGITLTGVAEHVARVLRGSKIETGALAVTSLVVDAERRGILSVTVRVPVAAAHAARAAATFEELERAHRRGQEPMTLNFGDIARTNLEFWSDGRISGRAAVYRSGLNARTLTPPIDPNELAPDSPGDRGRPADDASARGGKSFDLSNPYSIQGWYGDGYQDLIADRTETSITVGGAADALSAAHVAARLGLETTGASFPIAKSDDDVREMSREQNPIAIGRDNRLVRELEKIGRARFDDLGPGEGAVQIVPKAFGNTTATVVAGRDPAGTEAASLYLSRRVPYVWDNRRGAYSFSDLRTEANKFFAAKSAAGQAAQAVNEVVQLVSDLRRAQANGEPAVNALDAKVFLDAANPAFDTYLTTRLADELRGAKVTVKSETITAPTPVIDEAIDLAWEVDDFWAAFRGDVLPKVKRGATVSLEARLSESPELRKTLAADARAELLKAGASATSSVRVLSAYKQGFLWLTEQLIPELKGKGVRAVHIKVAEYQPDLAKKYKFYQVPSRWLHELYPVDEIIARELGVPKDQFSLELQRGAADIYTVEAVDATGKLVQRATFNPTFAEREYLDKFPGWSRVDVTTGWLRTEVDGTTVVDRRIPTDAERFWDYYQGKVLPRIYDYVMKVTDNRPLPDKQPFHRDLDVELWMSEPDFRIGVDEELVSSLESLHEDIYFDTLDFFDALGRTTTRRRLAAPGKIFPIVHPEQRGKPGKVHVLYAGNAATKPQLEIRYTTGGGEKPQTVRRELTRIDAGPAQALRAVVRSDAVSELELTIEAKDDREAARAADALDALAALHDAGLFKETLSLDHVDRLAITVAQKEIRTRRVLKNTGASRPSNVRTAAGKPARPIVTWDHIISPAESEDIVGRLAAFPEVKAYQAGESYRGRPISIAEFTLPAPGELVSLAKLTALKPTIFITGRQHANEVSSTSHILRLGELLVTDPAYRDILKKVNVILHPVENPDGAQMAYDLQKLTPTHMLHAGRYSALGMDVASQVGLADPLLPEALVRGRVWLDWLPDIYLNPHGYPSHEWVQQFAGYVPPGFRTYLSTRGWYTTMGGLRDPRYPEHMEAVNALRDAIVREINSNPDVREMNLRSQARYRRWAYGFGPWVYGQEIYKDTAIYYSDVETGEPRGARRAGASNFGGGDGGGAAGGGRFSMSQWPQVTFFSGGTESPDETAQGDWLALATKPGFSYLMANLKYLRDGRYKIERIEEGGQRDTTTITLVRVRPVMPGGAPAVTTTGTR